MLERAARRADQIAPCFDIWRRRVERSREGNEYRIAYPALGADAAAVVILNGVSAKRRLDAGQQQQCGNRAEYFSNHASASLRAKRMGIRGASRPQSYHAGDRRDSVILDGSALDFGCQLWGSSPTVREGSELSSMRRTLPHGRPSAL